MKTSAVPKTVRWAQTPIQSKKHIDGESTSTVYATRSNQELPLGGSFESNHHQLPPPKLYLDEGLAIAV
ncbi:MAG: hypothetical protein AAB511_00970 [Patescibacteria group bacterium]